jgi:hypothetical protein
MPGISLTRALSMILVLSSASACSSERTAPPPVPPPPLPVAPASAPEAAAQPSELPSASDPVAKAPDAPSPKAKKGASLYDIDPSVRPKKPVSGASADKPIKDSAPEPVKDSPKAAEKPAPEKPAPEKPVFVASSSKHVTLEMPAGLKEDLASDKRMKPWLDTAVAKATSCYQREAKSSPALSGVVEVSIIMHENARPDASLKSLPSQLAGVFTCVSGAMMGVKMPLFTGREGQRYSARVKFGP